MLEDARPRSTPLVAMAATVGNLQWPRPVQKNETETDIEQRLVAEERELGAVVESLAIVLEEVGELPAAVSSKREVVF